MRKHRRPVQGEALKSRLDALVETFDVTTIAPDPLQLVLRFEDPLDQEVAGLIAASFAYGRADTIVANIGAVLAKMRPSPYRYLKTFDPAEARQRFAGFAHRFHKTPELVAFLGCLAAVVQEHGSLGALFEKCYQPADPDIGPTLARFVEVVRGGNRSRTYRTYRTDRTNRNDETPISPIRPIGPIRPIRPTPIHAAALQYLLTSPDDGSACKRMNLYLRWMVRRTSPDLGLWTFVDPAKLVMPVDTHIHRIATFLGLNDRKSADWKAARLLTDKLAKFDRGDPVRYDFALCRLGILDLCSRKRRRENCDVCMLREVCRFPVTS